MGTYYRVSLGPRCVIDRERVEVRLAEINAAMSTYDPTSEISRLNHTKSGLESDISAPLHEVLSTAYTIWQETGGAFDITIAPLVELWGFGSSGDEGADEPSLAAQKQTAVRVGMENVRLGPDSVTKIRDGVVFDLNALAKGYGVDRLAADAEAAGCISYMIDIGGEIRISGERQGGGPWRIGIENPAPTGPSVENVLHLTATGLATSGDYRNFRLIEGKRVDHILDPRTGRPAENNVASVTVLHPSAMWADAYATAFMVMGEQDSMSLADEVGVAVYMLIYAGGGTAESPEPSFMARYNPAMSSYLVPARQGN